jgi:hypothetical protein
MLSLHELSYFITLIKNKLLGEGILLVLRVVGIEELLLNLPTREQDHSFRKIINDSTFPQYPKSQQWNLTISTHNIPHFQFYKEVGIGRRRLGEGGGSDNVTPFNMGE